MTTITYQWSIEHLNGVYNKSGQLMTRVLEYELGLEANPEPETFMVPSVVAEAFVRARREVVRRKMWDQGGVKLLLN